MAPRETVRRLAAFAGRGPCTDAERRAAAWARDALRARGRAARLETAWVRPQWPAVHAAHATLGVAGSLLATKYAVAGLAVLAVTLVSTAGELTGRLRIASLLWPRRATQCVVSEPAGAMTGRIRLVIAASLDAGRTGAAFTGPWARGWAAARRALRGHLSSPLAAMALALTILTAVAIVRVAAGGTSTLNVIALVPTVLLIIAFGALTDIGLSPPSPGANRNASGVAVALALAAELDRVPPRHLAVEVVLAGAGEGGHAGLRRYVGRRRREWSREDVALLAIGPCGAGSPCYFVSEGELPPLRLHPQLVGAAERIAIGEAHLGARAARRGDTGAVVGRRARWPALGVACAGHDGRAARERTDADVEDVIDDRAMAAALELCLGIVGELDRELAQRLG